MTVAKNILQKIGIDKSIAYTSSGRIIGGLGGVVTTLFIAQFLSKEEQGFYYTFSSVLAIQVFFEMGMNGIMTQYVAHEQSHLEWNGLKLVGDYKYRSRLSSLLHFTIKWYMVIAILYFAALQIAGFYFFDKFDNSEGSVSWKTPFFLLTISSAINLFLAPLFCFLEGLGKVKEVAKYRFFQQVLGYAIVWGSFFFGAKLMTPAINSLTWVGIAIGAFMFSNFGKILRNIWTTKVTEKIRYSTEIFPFQWKIAMSWISGYFIFQLFNPILFATEGAVVAGQMGMTLNVLNAISSLSLAWTSTKIPKYSGLIEMKKYGELDSLFFKTTNQAALVNASCLLAFFIVVFAIRHFHVLIFSLYLGDRFLDWLPMILMMIPIFTNQYINAWATYLRCHKKEPFLVQSVVMGLLCMVSALTLGKYFGLYGLCIGYCSLNVLVSTPWGLYTFVTKRKDWHYSNNKLV
jgi:O-antigen/teichoic acid export membrane protein